MYLRTFHCVVLLQCVSFFNIRETPTFLNPDECMKHIQIFSLNLPLGCLTLQVVMFVCLLVLPNVLLGCIRKCLFLWKISFFHVLTMRVCVMFCLFSCLLHNFFFCIFVCTFVCCNTIKTNRNWFKTFDKLWKSHNDQRPNRVKFQNMKELFLIIKIQMMEKIWEILVEIVIRVTLGH